MKLDVMYSSKSNEWATPQDFFDELDKEFHFNLDPCATDENHKCEFYFTQEDDGLLQNWGGTECLLIHHTVKRLVSGLKRVFVKVIRITRLLSCLFRQERIQNTSMTTYCIEQKSDLCQVG